MKHCYEVKLVEKKTEQAIAVLIEDMVSEGWELHRKYSHSLVFRRSVPENYIRAWFVVDWNTDPVTGKQVEVRHGPYFQYLDAQNVFDSSVSLRIEKTWIAPEVPAGERMERVAFLCAASPDDPLPVEAEPPKKKKPAPVRRVPTDELTPGQAVDDLAGLTHDLSLGRIRDFMGGTPASPNFSNITPPRPASRPRSGSRASVSARSHRANPGRPQQQQIRTNLLDAMRGVVPRQTMFEELGIDEPSEADIQEMREQQARLRHDQ